MTKIGYSLIASTLLFSNLSADPFITHVELSYMNASGNSETDTFAMKSDFLKKLDDIKSLKGKATGIYVTDVVGNETANKFYVEGEYNHKVSDNFFGFLKTNYTVDKFSGFDYRLNIGPGIGYQVPISNKAHNLGFSLGIAYSQDKANDKNTSEDYSSGSVDIKYIWTISDSLKLKQDVLYQQDFEDSENYSGKSVTAFEHKLSTLLSLGISYSVNYQHDAPAKDIDRLFLTSLIIDY